jgi:outer membrane immunogenic protein
MSSGASAQEVDWIKVYLGGHIGGDINTNEIDFGAFQQINAEDFFGGVFLPPVASQSVLGGGTNQDDENSIFGGALAGWNFFQSGNIVIGLEGDIGWTGAGSNATTSNRTVVLGGASSDLAIIDETRELNVDVEWKATLRGRIGQLVLPNLLLFFTGGIAFGEIDAKQTNTLSGTHFTGPPFNFALASFTNVTEGTDDNIHVGWVLGGGGDFKFAENLTGRLEALYIDLGSERYEFGSTGTADIDVSEVVVRAAFTIDLN